jgi:hypothetical protein
VGLWVLYVLLLAVALRGLYAGRIWVLLIAWVILTPLFLLASRLVDPEGWRKWRERVDRGDWWG